ncbi:hypothetical protein VTH06DRAFT_765 [Thermothelomyces fergusii]
MGPMVSMPALEKTADGNKVCLIQSLSNWKGALLRTLRVYILSFRSSRDASVGVPTHELNRSTSTNFATSTTNPPRECPCKIVQTTNRTESLFCCPAFLARSRPPSPLCVFMPNPD